MNKRYPEYRRKTPEEILEEIQRLKRGKLKLYLGSAPGVGKSYRMLQEAHDLKREGVDVVIGLIEPHGRNETADLIKDLEIVPERKVAYKGRQFAEVDVGAIIERAPDVVIIDELAHTNVPGLKNEKRYADVEDILEAGINVISAVNIQHLESLHDNVQQITGIPVRERIPDRILHIADEVILVDVSPETLQKRLKEGKIYAAEKIDQALSHFFTKNNLAALRELSLREVADEVDDRIEETNRKNGKKCPTGASEKILVCVHYGPNAEKLIRRGWRIADRLKAELFILTVTRTPLDALKEQQRKKVDVWRKLSGQFDARFIIEQAGSRKIPSAITDVVERYGITQVVLGQSARTRWEEILKGSIVNDIMRHTSYVDIHIVADYRNH